MNATRCHHSLTFSVLFILLLPSHSLAQLRDIDRQILIMTKPGMVSLSVGQISGWLEEIDIEADLKEALLAVGINWFVRAMPQFSNSDTLRVLSDGRIYRRPDYTNLYIAEVPIGIEPSYIAAELSRLPSIKYAELRRARINPRLDPNDEYFYRQWNMSNDGHLPGSTAGADVKAITAWSRTTGNSDIRIAILDWGILDSHNDFKDEFNNTRIIGDSGYNSRHGTMVAGVAAATGNNEIGVAGMDWKSTVISERMYGSFEAIAEAISSAVVRGARVINMSWGVEPYSQLLYDELLNAYSADVMLTVANPYYDHEERWPNLFGPFLHNVAASNFSDDPASYMTVDCPFTDLAAPGGDGTGDGRIYTTDSDHNNDYRWGSGTSLAAPHSTGLASLMLSLQTNLHNYDIEWLQKKTADGSGDHDFQIWGYGRLNADNATKMLSPPYELTQGSATIIKDRSITSVNFLSSPNGFLGEDHPKYLPPGEYEVDTRRIEVDIEFAEPYSGTPIAWLSHTGYSGDNPNNDPASYHYQHIHEDVLTYSHLKLRTYFYWIEIAGWIPYNPYDGMPVGHSRVGMPQALPSAPTALEGWYYPPDHGGPKVDLLWHRNPPTEGVDKYWLERAVEDGEFLTINKNIPDPGSGSWVTYTDNTWIPSGTEYLRYKAKAHNDVGWGPFCDPAIVELDTGPEMAEGTETIPKDLTLEPSFPNPSTHLTQIKFGLPSTSHVRLQIMNIRGQIVRVLVDDQKPAGWHIVMWDGKNASGHNVASGIYFYILESEGKRLLKKMTLIR